MAWRQIGKLQTEDYFIEGHVVAIQTNQYISRILHGIIKSQ